MIKWGQKLQRTDFHRHNQFQERIFHLWRWLVISLPNPPYTSKIFFVQPILIRITSYLIRIIKAWFAKLLVIFPVALIPSIAVLHVYVCSESVRALGHAQLRKETENSPLSTKMKSHRAEMQCFSAWMGFGVPEL